MHRWVGAMTLTQEGRIHPEDKDEGNGTRCFKLYLEKENKTRLSTTTIQLCKDRGGHAV